MTVFFYFLFFASVRLFLCFGGESSNKLEDKEQNISQGQKRIFFIILFGVRKTILHFLFINIREIKAIVYVKRSDILSCEGTNPLLDISSQSHKAHLL